MNMEFIDSLIDDGWSEEEIITAFNKRKSEKQKDAKLGRAREDLIDAIIEYLNAINPELVDFKDAEDEEKFCKDAEKELIVLEKFLRSTPTKSQKSSADDAIWNFLKKSNLA